MDELKRAATVDTTADLATSTTTTTTTSSTFLKTVRVTTSNRSDSTEYLEGLDYVNPLDSSSRWYLNVRASAIRYAASIGCSIGNRSFPPVPSPSQQVWLDSTLSAWKGCRKIKVEVWVPPSISVGPRPAVINFHGGGWILGQGTDDARWVGTVMSALDAVVFTVNYRLAPSYPFPTPVEDCVDAIFQIAARASEFGIDPSRLLLSGFSAGATMALSSWVVLQDPSRWNYVPPAESPEILGLIMFYPTLDVTASRSEKRRTCTRPERTLPPSLTDLFDASYLYPPMSRQQLSDPRLSPGLMSDELLKKLPPVHLCLCEHDMLLAEALRFCQRLERCDKAVSVRVVHGESHAWDKPPPMAPKESVRVEYAEATRAMARWLIQECETDGESTMRLAPHKAPRIRRPKHLIFRSRSAR
ncbi:hypothetical protein DCS_00760 [Drechmeria coniospora]|uniref:Alpha/beta hydrolase fold-3 domain-containing protein n=1 Tax=Drechmeria coniospora TaxID=98403 RepID=A0A151GR90_DRECN|nr:hypothetical protein DCS_00760 [Drechmeria coniospora]KYK59627.1 hypothetical protein DCS_00760 [Drechmeria coniospora]ODA76681.1 hypothetical protein RJ55_07952 [Drechmeria coniospora]